MRTSDEIERDAIRALNRSCMSALGRLGNEDPTSSAQFGSGSPAEDDDSTISIELGRRAMETPSQPRDTTGLDLADDMFGDLDDSFENGDVPLGGRSANTSSFHLSQIKTRSRQSSIIGRNDPPIRPRSRAGSTPGVSSSFNIGLFRRRAREPSILGTGRKSRADTTTTTQDLDSESEQEFAPDAESTPLNRRKTRSSMAASRDLSELPVLSASRKRKSDGAPDATDRPEKVMRSDQSGIDIESDSDSDLSSLASPPPPPRFASEPPVTPDRLNEILAPPASSGSEDEGDHWPDIHALARRRRRPSVTTPLRTDAASDMSSPPSLTHSPNQSPTRARGRSNTRRQRSPVLTTADLANLLPKRRQRATHSKPGMVSAAELDTSGLAHDEDELAHTGRVSRATSTRSASRAARNVDSALLPKQTTASNTRQASRGHQAYSRRSSDKENQSEDEEEESGFQPLPDDTFDDGTSRGTDIVLSADELRRAVRKFKEVDRWELSFEEDEDEGAEGPLGAR
jgi:ATP-dependent RNA helicase MRH4